MIDKSLLEIALRNAHEKKDFGKFQYNNSLRSAKFVYEVANELDARINPNADKIVTPWVPKVQKVDDNGNKRSGEWMFDICFLKNLDMYEVFRGKETTGHVPFGIDWVVESEYHTGLKEFCVDFGKLLVVNSPNVVYLNGTNQRSTKDFRSYVDRRLNTLNGFLAEHRLHYRETLKNVYLGFWPSPEKKHGKHSLWDDEYDELVQRIRLFKYDWDKRRLSELWD